MVDHFTVARGVIFAILQGKNKIGVPTRETKGRDKVGFSKLFLKSSFSVLLWFQISLPYKKGQDGPVAHHSSDTWLTFYRVSQLMIAFSDSACEPGLILIWCLGSAHSSETRNLTRPVKVNKNSNLGEPSQDSLDSPNSLTYQLHQNFKLVFGYRWMGWIQTKPILQNLPIQPKSLLNAA